ncbi:MAG: sugar transferase, partial [Novosphingobium sp.]|nr:sugar transferase [Novosphingobium sp.]
MIRLFKHYIPHAVILLWLVDLILLVTAGELAWRFRFSQIGSDIGSFLDRIWLHCGFAGVMVVAMIAVGVYGADALRSLRFAGARLLVAISLGVIALSFIDFAIDGDNFWRSTLAYGMVLAVVLLMMNRIVLGGLLGTSAFRRRVLVLGA